MLPIPDPSPLSSSPSRAGVRVGFVLRVGEIPVEGSTPPQGSTTEHDPGRLATSDLLAAANELFANEQFEHAASLYRYLLALRQRSGLVWFRLARCYEHLERFELAQRLYDVAQLCDGATALPLEIWQAGSARCRARREAES